MTTTAVANQLVDLCRQGKNEEAITSLYAENIDSVEANEMMGPKVQHGMAAILEKHKAFEESVEEFHNAEISEPLVAGNTFAITYLLDATFKGRGRMTMEEVCVYQVKDGKIILEQFFY
ncbi:SnoaL-like domain-containing protein [Flavobacterium sp.]|jgi:hypothetical protein|uniref:SnoaL-like domain-containing protein n=1 Tax=Flavobacterium sp. TaxID=239 RepID=UPI0037BFD586